jgi:hypothetical protein
MEQPTRAAAAAKARLQRGVEDTPGLDLGCLVLFSQRLI